MTLEEIKTAVNEGLIVHWCNSRYIVTGSDIIGYYIECDNGDVIGLTHKDGITLNGDESEFYIAE